MFNDYNPNTADISFDRDDLVGIALTADDPVFAKDIAIQNMYKGVVDESVDEINIVTKAIEDGVEMDETVPEPDVLSITPDESDTSYDGMDAEDEIDANQAIMSGEADEDVELFDLADAMD